MKRLLNAFLLCLLCFGLFPSSILAEEMEVLDEESLSEVTEAGTYPVRIEVIENGVQKEKIIFVTIVFPNTKVDEVEREAIDAHDFEVKKGYLSSLDKKELIQKAGARAWKTSDGSPLEITKVDILKRSDYINDIEFSTAKGTSVVIVAREVDSIVFKDAQESYGTRAYNFEVYQRYLLYSTFFLLFLIPLLIAIFVYQRSNKLYKETEALLYEK